MTRQDKPLTSKKHPGRPRKPIEQHKLDGTYRPERHDPPAPKIDTKPTLTALPTKAATKKWIRSEADERAVANGCRFSVELAEFVVKWVA